MPKSKYSLQETKQPKAIRQFIDREEFIESFERRLANYDYEHYHILVYYGIGGIGKTALQQELIKRLNEKNDRDILWGKIDFEDPQFRRATRTLRYLRERLGESQYHLPFYSFDMAFAAYWRKSNPDIPLNQENFPLIEHSDIVVELVNLLGDIPFIGLLPNLGKAAAKGSKRLQTWWNTRGNEELKKIQEKAPYEIEKWLPAFFASDITHAIKEDNKTLILFFDTYEALWESAEERTEGRFFEKDEWVRELINSSPGVLWCIGGRERLRWEELDPEWGKIIDQHLVGDFSDADATRLLTTAGLKKNEVIHAIINVAKGVPFYLDLVLDIWEAMTAQEEEPRVEDFHGGQRELFAKFMKYLDAQEQETLKVISIPRTFTRKLFEHLIEEFKTGYIPTRFHEFIRFSFVLELELAGTYTLHELMRTNLQQLMDEETRQNVHQFLFEQNNSQLHIDSINYITDHQINCLKEAFYHAKGCQEPEEIAAWWFGISTPFRWAGKWESLVDIDQELGLYLTTCLGVEHPKTVESMTKIGQDWHMLGKYQKAIELFEQALVITIKVYGDQHPTVIPALTNLSLTWQKLGKNQKAIELLEQALAIDRQLQRNERVDTASILTNLGGAWRALGEHQKAISLWEQALTIDRQEYGDEHPTVAGDLNNLGEAWGVLGEYQKAIELLEQALAINRQLQRNEYPDVARILTNLGRAWSALGEYQKAIDLYEQALIIDRQVYGDEHPDVAVILFNLGETGRALGEYQQAIKYHEQALTIGRQIYGNEHPEVAAALSGLGETWGALGKYQRAIECHEQALTIDLQVYGNQHPDVATILNNLGVIWHTLGNYQKAIELSEQALAIDQQVYGDEHLIVARDLNNLGEAWRALGEHQKAIGLLKKALTINQQVYGDGHPTVARNLTNLGEAWRGFGVYQKAIKLYGQALTINRKVYGDEHPDVALNLNNLGVAWQALEDYQKAIVFHEQALAINRQMFGDDHLNVATNLNNLGLTWYGLGEYQKAIEMMEQAKKILVKNLGEAHPYIGTIQESIEQVQRKKCNVLNLADWRRRRNK